MQSICVLINIPSTFDRVRHKPSFALLFFQGKSMIQPSTGFSREESAMYSTNTTLASGNSLYSSYSSKIHENFHQPSCQHTAQVQAAMSSSCGVDKSIIHVNFYFPTYKTAHHQENSATDFRNLIDINFGPETKPIVHR